MGVVAVTLTVLLGVQAVGEVVPLLSGQAAGRSVLDGGLVTPPLSSVSVTPVSFSLPVLQTLPVKVTSTPVPEAFTAEVQVLVTLMLGAQVVGQLALAVFETRSEERRVGTGW